MWLTSRQPTTGVRCGWMRVFISTLYVSRGWTPTLHLAHYRAVRGCNSMARRFAWFLRGDLRRWRQSLRGWGHGRHVGPGCQIYDLFSFGHYCFCLFCYFRCDLTLLLSVILLFPLWFHIIAFDYFVISVVIWHYLFLVIMSIVIELNMLLLLSVICCSLWVILLLLAYCCMYFAMVFLKHQK